jgi:hypothetical protein
MIYSHFIFFESLLEPNKYESLKAEFVRHYIDNVGQPFDVDFEKGIIYETPETEYEFSTSILSKINSECYKLKNAIIKNIYNFFQDEKNPNNYLLSELQHLESLIERLNESDFRELDFEDKLSPVVNFIEIRLGLKKSSSETYPTFNCNFSIDNIEQKLSTLYFELLQQNIIKGSKQDFINGFQGKKVINGIKWMICTKDKKSTNKPSLIYLLDYLIHKDYIEYLSGKEYNAAFIYVFRDLKGKKFKRATISTSKSNNTLKEHETIKNIIDNL